jgi:hypothetical protein
MQGTTRLIEVGENPFRAWLDANASDILRTTYPDWLGRASNLDYLGHTALVTAEGIAIQYEVRMASGGSVWVVAAADAPLPAEAVIIWSFEQDLLGRTDAGMQDFAYRMGEGIVRWACEGVMAEMEAN